MAKDVERAKRFIREHPDVSKSETARALQVSETTIARARRELVEEGALPESRKSQNVSASPPATGAPAEEKPPAPAPRGQARQSSNLLDHAALTAIASAERELDESLDKLTDEQIHRKLLKQCLRFAMDPKLHPDTRMSASQMWAKIKEQTRQRSLGPGEPVSVEEAETRLAEMMQACGPEITVAAVNRAFNVQEAPSGPAQDDQAPPAGGTPQAPVTA